MHSRYLTVAILGLGVLVGELHRVIKPQPTEKEIVETSSMWGGETWVGRMAPEFELKTTHGDSFTLSENVGRRVIVLNFFATWCGPCQAEMPELVRYSDKHKNDPFVLIGIDVDEKAPAVADFVAKYGVHYPVAIDAGPVEKAYGVGAYPTTVLIGVDGRIQFYQAGGLANADVAFDTFLASNRRIMETGSGITKDAYLSQLRAVTPNRPVDPNTITLDERGRRITALMDCPCGCDKRVAACTCHTSVKIKTDLAGQNFEHKTDAEIIKELNRKYCMAGM